MYPRQADVSTQRRGRCARWLTSWATTLPNTSKRAANVILFADPNTVKTDVTIGFSSIFWNTAWTGGQPPHTLGVLCNPDHPALAAFPTDYHSDWQWWDLISRSKPMVLDTLPGELRPIVQVVPDWFRPQRLGLVFEANVDRGPTAGLLDRSEVDLGKPAGRPANASSACCVTQQASFRADDRRRPGTRVSQFVSRVPKAALQNMRVHNRRHES